jgi:N-acetylglutamate synthase/N-acetylornithine aminotransferase
MSFAIDRGPLHRPLGFELALPRAIVATRPAWSSSTPTVQGAFELQLPTESCVVASARGVVDGQRASVLGVASGHVLPDDRASLRAWLLTDARPSRATLSELLRETSSRSFATIAGLASAPRESVVALANGLAGAQELELGSIGSTTLLVGLVAVAQLLVRQLLEQSCAPRPALLVQVSVIGASDAAAATRLAESVAASAAVRAALGEGQEQRESRAPRDSKSVESALLATIAAAGEHADESRPTVRVVSSRDGATIAIGVELDRGAASATRWTAVPKRAS